MRRPAGGWNWRKLAVPAALLATVAAILATAVYGCDLQVGTAGFEIDCRALK